MHVPPKNLQQVQLSITLLSYYWELGVFLDTKPSKVLRPANDTETFRDVSLTNKLILYANEMKQGHEKGLLSFCPFMSWRHIPSQKTRSDDITCLSETSWQIDGVQGQEQKGLLTLKRKITISTYYSRRFSGPPELKDSKTSVLT